MQESERTRRRRRNGRVRKTGKSIESSQVEGMGGARSTWKAN
jgi:hypothetical protein